MRKKRTVLLVSIVGIPFIALLAILAYLFFGGSKEPQADYAALVNKIAGSEERITSFVSLEPGGIHHIGDPITLRFGVAYDPRTWEVPDDTLRSTHPLPDVFEVRERKFRTVKINKFMLLEAEFRAQCFECRDKTYHLNLASIRVKNKETGDVTSVHFDSGASLPKIQFAPLTTGDYVPDENGFIVLKIKKEGYQKAALLALAGIALSASIALLVWNFFLQRRGQKGRQGARRTISPYLLRVQELKLAFQSSDASDVNSIEHSNSIAHSLYALNLLLQEACADSNGTLRDAHEDLAAVYMKEGASRERVARVLDRLEVFLKTNGEV